MASGLKGTSAPTAATLTTLYTVSGSATVVNVSDCNTHGSNADTIRIAVVPSGGTAASTHYIEYGVSVAAAAVVERTGIVLGVGDFLQVYSTNGTTSFNVWGVDLA